MEIRIAYASERAEIIAMYERSQLATGLPDPAFVPPAELGSKLYARNSIERFVALEAGQIVGHGLIEEPNSFHHEAWRRALNTTQSPMIEMGGAFVEPELARCGIWTALLLHRINVIQNMRASPVTATWASNKHVKNTFRAHGGIEAGTQLTQLGDVDLFVFQLR